MDLRAYQSSLNNYDQLSLKDLLDAQDLYHVHLMRHPNVVATAIGRYRIRVGDSWPDEHGPGKIHGKGERTLENSEVRPYSWPAILAFVDHWVPLDKFQEGGGYDPDEVVPKTLYLPDGRRVPVCVISAPRELSVPPTPEIEFPLNNIGGGRPITARVQNQEHVATVACLVRDGHKTYALTNRHVTGEPGEVVYTKLQGRTERIGVTATKQLTRMRFMELYPGFVGNDVFVNLDVGLIDIDRLEDWTAKIEGIGTMGPMFDLSVHSISLALVGCQVRGHGSASGLLARRDPRALLPLQVPGRIRLHRRCLGRPALGGPHRRGQALEERVPRPRLPLLRIRETRERFTCSSLSPLKANGKRTDDESPA